MAQTGVVAIVAASTDQVAGAVQERLRARHTEVLACDAGALSQLSITLDSSRFVVEGASVRGILWRIVPGMHLHLGFDQADQSFADSEVAAAWLAALNAPFIHAINRYSATVWYGGANWPTWRSWLRRQGVPVSAMHLGSSLPVAGARWMPFMSDAPRDAPGLGARLTPILLRKGPAIDRLAA